jgi:hypothetical protein
MYMSREEIDRAIEQRLGKPRWELSIIEVIQAIEQEDGEFFVRRQRKFELLDQLRELATAEINNRQSTGAQDGVDDPTSSGPLADEDMGGDRSSVRDYEAASSTSSSVKFVEMTTVMRQGHTDSPGGTRKASRKPPNRATSTSSKRSVRAVQNPIQEQALDMIGLLHGEFLPPSTRSPSLCLPLFQANGCWAAACWPRRTRRS